MVIVLMGVSGAGKTTVGQMLAESLRWDFRDADDLHSQANKRKMAAGVALTDADRAPWLESLRVLIGNTVAHDGNLVLACSALKQAYRARIMIDSACEKIVYLKGSRELIASRIAHRHHFISKDLLASQFDTLEEPHDAVAVDVAGTPESIVEDIRKRLGL